MKQSRLKALLEKPLAWHKDRQQGVGGSDAAAILGMNRFKSALEVYYEKIACQPLIAPLNEDTLFGLWMEAPVAELYQYQTGLKLRKRKKPYTHRKYPFMRVNVDRVIVNPGRGTGILEIKTAGEFAARAWEDEIPLAYYVQLQYQLACSGYDWGDVAVLVGKRLTPVPFERDDEFIEMMEKEVEHFWYEHVLKRIPPEPRDGKDVQLMYPKSMTEKSLAAGEEVYQTYQALKRIKAEIKSLQEKQGLHETQLKLFMKDAEKLLWENRLICTWKSSEQTRLDSKQLKKTLPNVFEEFSKTTLLRRFCLK